MDREIQNAVIRELAQKQAAYELRFAEPSAATVRKWRRRAIAQAEQEKYQLQLPFLQVAVAAGGKKDED